MNKFRDVRCPDCGEIVRIPIYWVLGVEGIFSCSNCSQRMKINYKLGALLTGLGCAIALGSIQLLAFFTCAFTVTVAVLAFIPLAFFYSFILRRTLLFIGLERGKRKKNY